MSVHDTDAREGRRIRYRPRGPAPVHGAVLLLLAFGACESTTVMVVDVEQVEVEPAETSVVAGGTTQLAALVRGPEGSPLQGWPVSWFSSDEEVATVDTEGRVTGHREGTVLITARVDGVSGSAFVEVLPGPEILPDRSEVTFAAPEGGNNPPDRTVAIANGGAGQLTGLSAAVDYSDGQPDGWLSASLSDTRAPTTLTLRATTGALPEETYTARVILDSPEAGQAVVLVSFAVGDPEPRIALDRTEVQLDATQGKAAPPPAEIRITNAGGQSLTGLGASVDYQQGGVGWLTAGLSPSTAPATLQIRADHDALAVGTHVAVVRVLSAVAVNSPREVTVRLVVSEPPPVIDLEQSSVQFTTTEGGADPDPVEVEITNNGGGTLSGLTVSISWDKGATGWLDAKLSGTEVPATLTLTPTTKGLAAGEHEAHVSVSAPGADGLATLGVGLRVDEPENEAPEADFAADCTLLLCAFQDRSEDPDGAVEAWDWDFGDGSTSSDRHPDHTYLLPGTYTVTLVVTDDDGATDEVTREVAVVAPANAPPEASFSMSCEELTCTFQDGSTDQDGQVQAWSWDFGDGGGSSTQNPSHTYTEAGTYTVTLEVTDDDGATDQATSEVEVVGPANAPPEADFATDCTLLLCSFQDRSEDPDGAVEAWDWDFGDGSTSSDRHPNHTYLVPGTYTVTLGVTDDDGATDQATSEVAVVATANAPPEASFSTSCEELTCTFQDGSTDQDGEVQAWSWDFGDGDGSSAQNPSHTYTEAGTYTVTLEVTDDDGATDQATGEVTVSVSDPNEPPIADFGVSCDDLECEFEDRSRDDDGGIVAREWSFGDGTTSTKKDPDHEYNEPGTYVVSLKVTDNDGATDTVEVSVTVDDDGDG